MMRITNPGRRSMKSVPPAFHFWGIACFLSLLISSTIFANNESRLVGAVIDETSLAPIPNVNIYFEATSIGTTSDQQGHFLIDHAPSGSIVLLVRHIGYFEKRISLKLIPQETKRMYILLSPKSLKLHEIIFTASRHSETVFKSHQDVSISTRENISARTSPNTADALREVPGILVQKTTAGHGAPVIRGMIGKDVLLLYNGIRLNKPTFRFGANQYMNTINVEALDRIEIIKGPGSVMYGSDAIGGVVNMITESFPIGEMGQRSHFSFSSRYGTADQARMVNAMVANRFGKLTLSGNLGFKKIGNLKAGENIGKQIPTGYDEWNANGKVNYSINSQTNIELDVLTVQQDKIPRYDKYVTGEYETFLYDPQNRYLAALTLKTNPIHLNWISSIRWNFSYQLEEEGTIERETNSNSVTKNRNDLTTFGSYLQISSIVRQRQVLTYGYEIYWDKVKSSRTREENNAIESKRGDFPDGSIYRSLGLFVNDNFIFHPKFDVILGLRWSYVSLSSNLEEPLIKFEDNFDDLTGTCGLSYKPYSGVNLIARYAKGFRAPNFNDTVVLKVSNSGYDAPSPGLSPEKSHNFEVGIKLNHARTNGALFLFYNRVVDLIDRYRGVYNGFDFYDKNGNGIRDPKEVDIFQKRNVARAYIAGWELHGGIRLSDKWSFRGFAFWTYGQNITLDEPMSRIPPFVVMSSVQFNPTKKISFETFVRAATEQDRLSSRDKEDSRIPPGGTPGWSTINFRCSGQLVAGLNAYFIFENILNETFKEHGSGVYSPGRGIVFGLNYGDR